VGALKTCTTSRNNTTEGFPRIKDLWTLCGIGRAMDRDRRAPLLTHPIPEVECAVPALFCSKGTQANLGSFVLVGFEALKYYSERQNAHSQIGNTSGGSETVVG
jgi:hypothetical protein